MHFIHPELLYALFLLVIPVLIHLFQLRKFRKEKFTNIKFLKRAALQTRKSSRIKKWLVLFTRLGLLASIIIAFAQPFIPASEKSLIPAETVIYLDNSYSMQARGTRGILLKRSVQELLENLPQEQEFTLFTNNSTLPTGSIKALRQELQEIEFSPDQLDWRSVELTARKLFSDNPGTQKNFIAVSDFQTKAGGMDLGDEQDLRLRLIQLQPENTTNVSVDSILVSSTSLDQRQLEIRLSGTGDPRQQVSVSLYNGSSLLGKKTVDLDQDRTARANFTLSSRPVEHGRVTIEDTGMEFDDKLFFSIHKSDPIRVTAINGTDGSFLERLFREPDFDMMSFEEGQVDFNQLTTSDLVVLNELRTISPTLSGTLERLLQENMFLIMIPAGNANLQSYNSFFRSSDLPVFEEKLERELLITGIAYDHPLFRDVFEEKAENFQYPEVSSYYRAAPAGIPVLTYQGGQSFLTQKGNTFVFTAPLNRENSNFTNAPLIVPTLYSIGNQALEQTRLYYTVGQANRVDIKTIAGQDEILKLVSPDHSFIPLQQTFKNKVELRLGQLPEKPGHYSVQQDSVDLRMLSFNIDRRESILDYHQPVASGNVSIHREIPQVFEEIKAENNIRPLWKWFVIFALFLLLTEMLILKYLK